MKWSNGLYGGTFVMKSLKGIICKETASGILELSTFPPFPVLIYNEFIDLTTSHFRFIKTNRTFNNIIKLDDGLFVTNKEQTIIDMLEDGEHRILMESLDTYLSTESMDKLESLANEQGLFNILKLKLIELDEFREEY